MEQSRKPTSKRDQDPGRKNHGRKNGIEADAIELIARMERVSPAVVKATAMAVGHDRPKLVATIRANKS